MKTLRQAAEQALEALQATMATHDTWEAVRNVKDEAITAIQEALAQCEWVGLTDEDIGTLTVFDGLHHVETPLLADFIRAIEARLKEKNA